MKKNNRRSPLWPLFYLLLFSTLFFSLDHLPHAFGWEILHDSIVVLSYLIGIIVWILLAVVINRCTDIFLWEGIFERKGKNIPKLLRDMVASVIMLAAIGGIISVVFKKDLTILLAATGGLGVIVGLAIKELIADVFSGLALNLERTFIIGDIVRVGDIEGEVVELNWRATHIRTPHNTVVVYPNSRISTAVVTNLHKNGTHFRAVFDLHLDHSIAPKDGLRVLNAAVKHVQHTIEQNDGEKVQILDSDVIASDIDEIGVLYQIRYWLPHFQHWPKIRNRVISSVMEQLKWSGIQPALPQQQVIHSPQKHTERFENDIRNTLIRRTSFFADISDDDVEFLSNNLEKRICPSGSDILIHGEEGSSMFFILEGLADVYIWIAAKEQEIRVASMISGTSFGEMSLLTGEPRSATIRANTDVILYELKKEQIQTLLHQAPQRAQVISSVIAEYKLKDIAVREKLSQAEQVQQTENFAKQLLSKIQLFFNLSS
jgi:small-conductance mechanosensitive channel/CRP-like cAMP-binding protein